MRSLEKAFGLFSISAHETLISAICGRNSKEIPKCLTEIVIIGISNPGSNFLDLNRRILQQFFRPGHSDHKEVFLNGHLIMLAKKACEILLGKEVLLRITADLKGLWIVLVNVLPDPGDNFIRESFGASFSKQVPVFPNVWTALSMAAFNSSRAIGFNR